MSKPSRPRPPRRILASVTIIDTGHGRYHVDVVTAHGSTRDSASTMRDAMTRAAAAIASMDTTEQDTTEQETT